MIDPGTRRAPRAPVAGAWWLGAALLVTSCGGSAPIQRAPVVDDRFTLPDDLEITLWAESPMFMNPTNIDVDARGRVWVAEAYNYRTFHEGQPRREGGDRIVILDDTDGDGVADSSTVFVQDEALVAPLGISVIDNRVVVSASPSVLVYTDEDGDDRADRKEVFLTGFGGLDHDHGLHVVTAGPDGNWYLSAGNQGPHVVTDSAGWTLRSGSIENGGSPHAVGNSPGRVSDDGRVWTGGLLMRIGPDGRGLRVLAHNMRNSYETAVDSYGDLWQSDNDDQVVATRSTWVMENGNLGYFGGGGARRWRADRRPGQDMFTTHWHQDDPGVQPAGDRVGAGSPAGGVVYEGDALGRAYHGIFLSAEAGRNVLLAYRTSPAGAGFHLERFDLLRSVGGVGADYVWTDDARDQPAKWFRPSDVAVGTDGALYVADWYDPIVGGHQAQDTGAAGRIYRIAPKGKVLPRPDYDLSTTEGQIAALLSPAVNVRYAGFVRLRAQGARIVPRVRRLLASGNGYHRARAVWLLSQLGPEGEREVERLFDHPDPRMRTVAFRALRQVVPDILPLARRLARDPSPGVRREVAIALRGQPADEVIATLAEGFDGQDRWYLEALGTASEGREEAIYARLRERWGMRDPAAWDPRFAGIAWRLHPKGAVADLAVRAGSPRVAEAERERAMVALGFIDDPAAARAMAALTRSELPDVARNANWWLAYRQGNDWSEYVVSGIATAPVAAGTRPSAPMLRRYRLFGFEDTPIDQRVDAALQLAEDAAGGRLLVAALSAGRISDNIRNAVAEPLARHPDPAVRLVAQALLGGARRIAADSVLAAQGDVARGQTIFHSRCAVCHSVGGAGADFGPDLGGVAGKFDRRGLVEAIVNPGGAVAHDYQAQLLVTREGEVHFGFVLADGPTVTFRDASGQRVRVERERIELLRPLGISLMPGPDLLDLDRQGVADVAAWLSG